MLRIQRVESLAEIVGTSELDLRMCAEFARDDVTERVVHDVGKKPRLVISVQGQLREFQERFYRNRLCDRLVPSAFSFGGIRGRHIVANANRHIGNPFVYKTDISDFYPSISVDRVNRLFLKSLGCSPEVSNILTWLCTYDFHLALGLSTSPILADQILIPVDQRIAGLCEKFNATYSRFVDDITISAKFDIGKSPIPETVARILKSHGLRRKASKTVTGRLDRGRNRQTITGLRVKGTKVDVSLDYVTELERQLADHASLAANREFRGPLFTSSQLSGRVNYVCWVNRGREFSLRRKLGAINWTNVWAHADERGLACARKEILLRNEPPPDFSKCYGNGDAWWRRWRPGREATGGIALR